MRTRTSGQGRPKGSQNKLTKTVKEAVKLAFDTLQEDKRANLVTWAKDNPTDFYKIAAKLIPNAVEAELTGSLDINRVEWIVRKPANIG